MLFLMKGIIMGKIRKPAPSVYAPREKNVEEIKLDFKPCCNCGKAIEAGYYGRFEDGGVCSKKCNIIFEEKYYGKQIP